MTATNVKVGVATDVKTILEKYTGWSNKDLVPKVRLYNDAGVIADKTVIISAGIRSARELGGNLSAGVLYEVTIQVDTYALKSESAEKISDDIIDCIFNTDDSNGYENRKSSLFTTLSYIRPSRLSDVPVAIEKTDKASFYRKILRMGGYTKT